MSLRIVGRGVALIWGAIFAVDALGRFLAPGFDSSLWWVDLRGYPGVLVHAYLTAVAAALLGFGLRPEVSRARLAGSFAIIGSLTALMLSDGLRVLELFKSGALNSDFPFPMSFVAAVSMGVVLAALRARPSGGSRLGLAVTMMACAVAIPLAQMFCFGLTSYERPADIAVVLGARAYADGTMSNALEHRVKTACSLYQRKIVGKLLFSGGPGDGPVHETDAMRNAAVAMGVPAADILLDPMGLNTRATAANTIPMIRALGFTRVIAVSHFYHLPRVKMTFQAAGMNVSTVPAIQERPLRQLPWLIAREVPGLWLYYLRAALLAS